MWAQRPLGDCWCRSVKNIFPCCLRLPAHSRADKEIPKANAGRPPRPVSDHPSLSRWVTSSRSHSVPSSPLQVQGGRYECSHFTKEDPEALGSYPRKATQLVEEDGGQPPTILCSPKRSFWQNHLNYRLNTARVYWGLTEYRPLASVAPTFTTVL